MLKGLSTSDLPVRLTVLCSADETRIELEKQGLAKVLQPKKNAGGLSRQFWVWRQLGHYVGSIEADLFISINQYVPRVRCPQIVYHLNLLRFMPIETNGSLKHGIFEWLRNRNSKQALIHSDANVYESAFIQECAEKVYQNNNRLDQVIYIGLPDNLLMGESKEPREFKNNQLFSITNGNPHKDNTTLIHTIYELVQRKPEINWQLKIAGGLFSDLWKPYRAMAKELGLEKNIEWLGFLDQDQLTDQISRSLWPCFDQPSRVILYGSPRIHG